MCNLWCLMHGVWCFWLFFVKWQACSFWFLKEFKRKIPIRGSVTEYLLYFKCHRIYYTGSVTEYTNLLIFCDTCPKWDFHYNIFKDTCFRVYILRYLILKYNLQDFLYRKDRDRERLNQHFDVYNNGLNREN